jgi:hypothetical protein
MSNRKPYDISNPPSSEEWLAMDEGERIEAVREAHERTRSAVGQNPLAHATIHVLVENQLAEGHAAIIASYDRFRAAGVDRHNTVHALASVVTHHMMKVLQEGTSFDQAAAEHDFAALDPGTFKRKR